MQPKWVVALAGGALLLASACLIERSGRADGDADVDSDSDTDTDSDSDGDEDVDGDPDVEGDGDEEPDGETGLHIDDLDPTFGYTSGWLLDPRNADGGDEGTLRIEVTGVSGRTPLDVAFDGAPLERGCDEGEEGCIQLQGHLGEVVYLLVRYPPSDRAGEVEILVEGEGGSDSVGFDYRVLPIETTDEAEVSVDPVLSVDALAPGCFAAASAEACASRGAEVAVGGTPFASSDSLAVLDGIEHGTSALSAWGGGTVSSVRSIAPAFFAVGATVDSRPELTVMGPGTVQFFRYVAADPPLASASGPPCGSSPAVIGVGAGELDDEPGDEVLLVFRGATTFDFHVLSSGASSCALGEPEHDFDTVTSTPGGDRVLRPAVADLDADGHDDVAIPLHDEDGQQVLLVLWGDGDGGFAEVGTRELDGGCPIPGDAVAAELDGDEDGYLDVVIGCTTSADVQLIHVRAGRMLVDGGLFDTSLPTGGSALVALGFLNGDEIPDIVVADQGTGDVAALLGTRDPADALFTLVARPATPDFAVEAIAVADLDGDRFGEIVLGGVGSSGGVLQVYWTSGPGSDS